MVVTALFFVVTLALAWSRGKLIDSVGKLLTPMLFLLLVVLALGVLLRPQGEIVAPVEAYQTMAFSKGFIGGYNTMDTFAALMFGMLLVDVLRGKGVTAPRACFRYLSIAGVIAAIGLAFVYVSLFWLGATSSSVAPGASNGGVVLAAYVQALFGQPGQWILSLVVLLACLTTAVGLVSACADYFSTLTPLRYRQWVVLLCVICAVVANVGLSRLIALSVPVLMALYPLAIALVVLTFIRRWLRNPLLGYRLVMLVALLCSLMDGARAAGAESGWLGELLAWQMRTMPLAADGMAWCCRLRWRCWWRCCCRREPATPVRRRPPESDRGSRSIVGRPWGARFLARVPRPGRRGAVCRAAGRSAGGNPVSLL
ncbi:branched-chain amino acid transport system II carrier protein [Edwardsiella anguillarum]|nr:branched-chain amino acid transport system II carrier protein [Edwardsiella anguillarum]